MPVFAQTSRFHQRGTISLQRIHQAPRTRMTIICQCSVQKHRWTSSGTRPATSTTYNPILSSGACTWKQWCIFTSTAILSNCRPSKFQIFQNEFPLILAPTAKLSRQNSPIRRLSIGGCSEWKVNSGSISLSSRAWLVWRWKPCL